MTREEWARLAKTLKAAYTDPKFLPDQYAFSLWYEMLKDIPFDTAVMGVHRYIVSHKYIPSIADIRECCVAEDEPMTGNEAWQIVRKALRNSIYNAQEEFDKLPERIQRAVGGAGQLTAWAMQSGDTLDSVDKSHFLKSYAAVESREKNSAMMPEKVKNLLSEKGLVGIGTK